MTNEATHRIGLVRADPDYWVCLCRQDYVKPRLVKFCDKCGARESDRHHATWDDAQKFRRGESHV